METTQLEMTLEQKLRKLRVLTKFKRAWWVAKNRSNKEWGWVRYTENDLYKELNRGGSIEGSFRWKWTDEGSKFWIAIHHRLMNL